MTFLGPEGVSSRMSQIGSRLDALFPREAPDFERHLSACGANPPLNPFDLGGLSGPIGPGGAIGGLQAMAQGAASRNGVDPGLFGALVDAESAWNARATSPAGAKGLCQLMDGTARELGVIDPYDPQQSLDGGAKYLRRQLDAFGGDPAKALAAYNAGPGFVAKHSPAQWPAETKSYVSRILSRWGGGV